MIDLKQIAFLQGERIHLRALELSDLEQTRTWVNDPRVRHGTTLSFPYDDRQQRAWWEALPRGAWRERLIFAIIREEDQRHVGQVEIASIDWLNRRAQSGTMIGPEFWGLGYATEAKGLLLKFCFGTLGMRRMESEVLSFNEASVRHLLANGYVEEGRRRQAILRAGVWWDELLFGVTEAAFKASKNYREADG